MKRPVALLLGIAVGGAEAGAALDESLTLQPHVGLTKHENKFLASQPHVELEKYESPQRKTSSANSSGGASDTSEPLAHLRWRLFYKKMLRSRGKKFGMLNALVDTARDLAALRPDLKQWERECQAQMLHHEIKMIKLRSRGCKDYSPAMPAIRQALGL
jgi:hypothetical protein